MPPSQVATFTQDPTPGTLPSTLVSCLNSVQGAGTWGICHPSVGAIPILWLASQVHNQVNGHPVAALLALPDGQLHWVTVVSVSNTPQCTVTYLENGTQTTVSCSTFVTQWSLNDTATGIAVQYSDLIGAVRLTGGSTGGGLLLGAAVRIDGYTVNDD